MGRRTLAAIAVSAFFLGIAVLVVPLDGQAERARIEAHLERAADRLRSHEPAGLTPTQRAGRRATLAWLDEYRETGTFPHNHVRPDARVPIFVDPHGTPCAVGYLLLRSGEDALVEEIVSTDNLVRVPELRGDPRFERWLDSRGITLEEAAMIQPAYSGRPPQAGTTQTSDYVPATVGVSLATAALVSYNAIAGTDAGGPIVDGLLIGAALGHLYLLADDGSGEHHASAGFNAVGIFAAVGTELLRLMSGSDERRAAQAGLGSHLAPGPNGMEVGLTFRH